MVKVKRPIYLQDKWRIRVPSTGSILIFAMSLFFVSLYCINSAKVKFLTSDTNKTDIDTLPNEIQKVNQLQLLPLLPPSIDIDSVSNVGGDAPETPSLKTSNVCKYKSISDLSQHERYPAASEVHDGNNRRHMVDPPHDGTISLVCCETTAGPLSIAVHHSWAPLGARRFLEMVRNHYFSSRVPLMRCIQKFICQFGIAGDPSLNKAYGSIPDDFNWLPEGPDHRTNAVGANRYARGYFAYAGAGPNSRSQQFIVALGDNKRLGGGSPWEVPWGEVVGTESYNTLGQIYTGYGEKGPSQALLHKEGASPEVDKRFPKLDYMTSCTISDEVIA